MVFFDGHSTAMVTPANKSLVIPSKLWSHHVIYFPVNSFAHGQYVGLKVFRQNYFIKMMKGRSKTKYLHQNENAIRILKYFKNQRIFKK